MEDSTARPAGADENSPISLGRFNLAVLGFTGVGKSTLVEAVFGAAVGRTDVEPAGWEAELPVAAEEFSANFDTYADATAVVTVAESTTALDDQSAAAAVRVLVRVARARASRPLSEQLHAVWWVRTSGDDVSDAQRTAVGELAKEVPVMMVISRVPASLAGRPEQEAIRRARFIESLLLPLSPANQVYLTNARADSMRATPVHGLADLRNATFACAPEAARRAQAAGQANRRMSEPELAGGEPITAALKSRLTRLQAESEPLRSALRQGWERFSSQRWR